MLPVAAVELGHEIAGVVVVITRDRALHGVP
jgi:hypothetical protein